MRFTSASVLFACHEDLCVVDAMAAGSVIQQRSTCVACYVWSGLESAILTDRLMHLHVTQQEALHIQTEDSEGLIIIMAGED